MQRSGNDAMIYHTIPRISFGKVTINTRKHRMQARQEVSPFPAGDHKAARNRHDSMTEKHEIQITKMIHKRNTTFERLVRKLTKDLNMCHGTNLTLTNQNKATLSLFISKMIAKTEMLLSTLLQNKNKNLTQKDSNNKH